MQRATRFPAKAIAIVCALALVVIIGLSGCSGAGGSSSSSSGAESVSGSITVVGSTALQPLVEAAAEQFMAENPDVQITVQGGGSGQGITQIVAGSVQIGDSDVFAESKVEDAADLQKIRDNQVAVVGMGPVVNEDVTIDDIGMDDLKGIFTGRITNWSELGGPDEAIVVINRASGSGTRATFESAVLGDEKAPADFTPQEQDSSGTAAQMVANTPGAITYLAFSYFDDSTKALSIDGVEPTAANVAAGAFPIWSYEHMYTAADPDDATQAFIDYMLGDEVQGSLVFDNGYISIADMKVAVDADGNVERL